MNRRVRNVAELIQVLSGLSVDERGKVELELCHILNGELTNRDLMIAEFWDFLGNQNHRHTTREPIVWNGVIYNNSIAWTCVDSSLMLLTKNGVSS